MIGIKGTGMSALAVNLKSMGIEVSGSDYAESFFTDSLLAKHKIKVKSPFSTDNIPQSVNLVIVSTAYNNKNPELQEAGRQDLKILTYPQMLGLITKKLKSIAVCGSHGKTTTSGVLSYVLSKTVYRPIVNVGSIVPQLVNYRARNPKLFVFEADEYQNKFQYFFPNIVILTNIDYDHPDYFKTPAHYKSVFQDFVKKVPRSGLLIYCADDKSCRDVAKYAKCKKINYGFSKQANARIADIKINPATMTFDLRTSHVLRSTAMPENIVLNSRLLGKHNALNLAAAAICASYLKVEEAQIKKTIMMFTGTKRRLEITRKLKINGHNCLVIDDFGHHPTEIRATIETIKAAYPDKTIWSVFQPHSFSRTQALFGDFARCFDRSDKIIILDIYGSKRETSGKVHSRDLVKAIKSANAFYRPDIQKAAIFIKKKINSDSIILTIGASEVWRLAELL